MRPWYGQIQGYDEDIGNFAELHGTDKNVQLEAIRSLFFATDMPIDGEMTYKFHWKRRRQRLTDTRSSHISRR